jgi:hypothetical protein
MVPEKCAGVKQDYCNIILHVVCIFEPGYRLVAAPNGLKPCTTRLVSRALYRIAYYQLKYLPTPALEDLRAPLAKSRYFGVLRRGGVGAVLLFPTPYHGVLAVKGCAFFEHLRSLTVFDPVTACAAPC